MKYIIYSKIDYVYLSSWEVGTEDIDYILSNRRQFYFLLY